jgi:hypothetical protein
MKTKVTKPDTNRPAVICVPGYQEVKHLSTCHDDKTLFLLAAKEVPLSSSDKQLIKDITRATQRAYGARGLLAKFKRRRKSNRVDEARQAREELIELQERQKLHGHVRFLEGHGLFIGGYEKLEPAEITDLSTTRRGEVYALHYSFFGVEGKLVLPTSDEVVGEPVAVHGGNRIPLKTLI